MGYYANGSGNVNLKPNVDKKEIEKQLKSLHNEIESDMSDTEVYFWEHGNYNEDDTKEFLNTLIPYINDGNAEYTGEDCLWRFILVNGEWERKCFACGSRGCIGGSYSCFW